ncbi:MAG: hypothetical protein JSW52_02670 [Candidatus Coatesbacteria bacterium]|nr:MAG: hypothetical protein JSW52_02670 [Candidatus Coatesbacteria bacterium]
MNRIARIVFTGLIAGLAVFVVGNVVEVLSSFVVHAPETTGKLDLAATILLTFLFDIIAGLLITFAYGIVKNGLAANPVFRALTFAGVLVLVNALPRAADAYVGVPADNAVIATWLASWILEAVLAAFIVILMYPREKKLKPPKGKKPEPGPGAPGDEPKPVTAPR